MSMSMASSYSDSRASSSVPQGSSLGPLLFSLFVNDTKAVIRRSHFIPFADDIKILKDVLGFRCCRSLQINVDALSHRCKENKMILNAQESLLSCTCKDVPFKHSV